MLKIGTNAVSSAVTQKIVKSGLGAIKIIGVMSSIQYVTQENCIIMILEVIAHILAVKQAAVRKLLSNC